MRILTVSDKVSANLLQSPEILDEYKDIALILSCGDLPPEFLASLRHRYDVPLYYILGNHDLRYQSSPPDGCQHIHGQIIDFMGLRIVGFSGSRWYNGGMNQYTEKQMRKIIGRMRLALWRSGAPDIVITHAPPRYIHDAEDPCHKGFKSYINFIDKYRPSYFIHGHIHRLFKEEDERITLYNTTKVINSYGFHVIEI